MTLFRTLAGELFNIRKVHYELLSDENIVLVDALLGPVDEVFSKNCFDTLKD